MIHVGDDVLLRIVDIAIPSGHGVARFEGLVVFVPGGVPGDVVRVKIVRLDRNLAYGEVLSFEETSPDRLDTNVCSRYGECGGCELQALPYEKQLSIKENHLLQVLSRIGGVDLSGVVLHPIVPSVDRCFYRSKIEFAFGVAGGRTIVGLSERSSPFRRDGGAIVPVDECRLFSPVAAQLLPAVREFLLGSGLRAYDPVAGIGTLKRLVLRESKSTKELMVNVVVETPRDGHVESLLRHLVRADPAVTSVYMTSGRGSRLVHGRAYINELLGGLTFRIYPLSFFQPNPRTAEELYRRIVPAARIEKTERVAGLYCGAGTFELFLGAYAKEVVGVDSSAESIACAEENALANRIENVVFLRDKVERAAARLRAGKIHVAVIDPPRAGMSKEALSVVKKLKPERLVYVSCNPSTLARDLKMLRPDYLPRDIAPYDFFPHTGHFEVLTLLERR